MPSTIYLKRSMVKGSRVQHKLGLPYYLYLFGVTLLGTSLFVVGIYDLSQQKDTFNFWLILFLAVVAQFISTSTQQVAFEVGTAVGAAAIPFYGPLPATIIAGISNIVIWFLHPGNLRNLKQKWHPFVFNIGMSSLAIFLAGTILVTTQQWFGLETGLRRVIPWLLSAISYDQINIWLVLIIIRLQKGPTVKPFDLWRQNAWAMPINIMIIAVGGMALTFAIQNYKTIGILIFYLPIFLSAYAFRLYVRRMQQQVDTLEQKVNERTQTLAELIKEKDSFLAVLTHDMKTPLTSIGLYLDMIEAEPATLQKKPHILHQLRQNQKSLLDIVNNILDLERLEATGSLPLDKTMVDLLDVAQTALASLQVQATRKEITLLYHPTAHPLWVNADLQQMKRVFHNLLSNAIKYSPHQAKVTLSFDQNQEWVMFDVVDTGFGIPAEDMPHVFDRFHRIAKYSQSVAGTGLGLSITKAIVEAHQGSISVTSTEGCGSTFRVQLPVRLP